MRTLILSDVHLGSRNCHAEEILQLLDREVFDRLILNGDTVNSVNLRKLTPLHWQVLSRFREIGKSRELILIRGNHDHEDDHHCRDLPAGQINDADPAFVQAMNGRASQNGHVAVCAPRAITDPCPGVHAPEAMGSFQVLPSLLETPMLEEFRLEVGDRHYLVMHGDRFDPTLRYPVVTEMADFCYQLSQKISRKLAKWLKKKSKRWGGLLDYVRTQTVAHAREREHAGIITGHTHFAADAHIDGVHYLNSGCWTDNPCSYLLLADSAIHLHYYPQ